MINLQNLNKFIISISLFSLSIIPALSQQNTDYKKHISKSISYFEKSCISVEFKLVLKEKNNVNSQSIPGSLIINGQKFYLKSEDMQVWFNGKTQWSYSKSNQEITITNPTREELAAVNPLVILSILRDKAKLEKSVRSGIKSTGIKAIPLNGSINALSLDLDIEQSTGKINQIWMTEQRGTESRLILTNYKTVECKSATFEFNQKTAPNAILNDLR